MLASPTALSPQTALTLLARTRPSRSQHTARTQPVLSPPQVHPALSPTPFHPPALTPSTHPNPNPSSTQYSTPGFDGRVLDSENHERIAQGRLANLLSGRWLVLLSNRLLWKVCHISRFEQSMASEPVPRRPACSGLYNQPTVLPIQSCLPSLL